MSSGLYSGVSGLALGTGLYRDVSGLWSGASGLIAGFDGGNPYSGASLYLDFLTMTAPSFDTRITFSRGSNATLVDSTGKITYAPANLLTYSEQFDNAAWTKSNSSVTANAVAAPDGATTADKLVENTSNSQHAVVVTSGSRPTIAAGLFTQSIYVKAAERSSISLYNNGTSGGAGVVFNLANGTIGTSGGTQYSSSSITSIGNGWYRCSLTFVSLGGTSALTVYLGTEFSGEIYTGDGYSGIYIWGAQLEPVTYQTTPSTYQATTSTAYYGPRFDYDPVTLAAKGLLIEEQRANLALYSEQFNNAASWTASAATLTAAAASSPDGTTTAASLADSAANSAHLLYQGVSTVATTTYAFSVYAKAGTGRYLTLSAVNGTSTGAYAATFDLQSGTVTQSGAYGASATYGTSGITNAGNGWWRIYVTGTGSSTATTLEICPSNAGTFSADTFGRNSYAGSGSTYFIYGAQLESGSFATSYIPTVASTVTRSADDGDMTGANFSSWYNQAEGTFVVDASTFKPTSSTAVSEVISANDGTTNNRITTRFASNTTDGVVVTSGSAVAAISTAYIVGVPTKCALAAAANNFAFAVNGALIGTDTSGGMPTVNKLDIGNLTGFNFLNGHIRSIAYYNVRLPDAQLQSLTT